MRSRIRTALWQHFCLGALWGMGIFLSSCTSAPPPRPRIAESTSTTGTTLKPAYINVDWKSLFERNPSLKIKEFLRESRLIEETISTTPIPYPSSSLDGEWDMGYHSTPDKMDFMSSQGVDCSRFLWHLFAQQMNLPYNSAHPKSTILSTAFSNSHKASALGYFTNVPKSKKHKGFIPQEGDILSFPGHVLAVLDAQKCTAIQSTSWVCEKTDGQGRCQKGIRGPQAGVVIYKLHSKRDCDRGIWYGLDAKKNRFTAGWRHKALDTWIASMPKTARTGHTITLQGRHLSEKYVFFKGVPEPIQVSKSLSTEYASDGKRLDKVSLTIPDDAQSGFLKIYWGRGAPRKDTLETVESGLFLKIKS